MGHTIAIDFGSKYVGIALVRHSDEHPNQVRYAATLTVQPKPLKSLSEPRAATRRLRRTRKTHRQRLRRLAQALADTPHADEIVRFCRRRGFSYEPDPQTEEGQTFHVSRERFFQALESEIARHVDAADRKCVLAICRRHLNASRRPTRELRPARFENRGRTRCNWRGCRNNVPRNVKAVDGRLRQSLFLWLLPVIRESIEPERFCKSLDHWIGELTALSKAWTAAERKTDSEDVISVLRKPLSDRIRRVFKNLLHRVDTECSPETAETFRDNWKSTYREIVSDIVRGRASGRGRLCRQHSAQYVEYILAGKQTPVREEVRERDIVARTQQILFGRLWRLIEGRMLPLAGGHIDRIVVERVAFDVLSGPLKVRQKLSDDKAAELYWNGPQAGFRSRGEMLRREYDGRCAYCGRSEASLEEEHLFPRSQFPFDSYLNAVPACNACNIRKGGRTLTEAGMTVHTSAYAAYDRYLSKRKIRHPFHTIKKGLLNLLCRSATADRAQRMIGMIADNLVQVTHTQRSPRPLARYLATRCEDSTGVRPTIDLQAGRHTALYRSIILPEYVKRDEKAAGDVRNHAVDAILLGCQLPSASALENRNWTKSSRDVAVWMDKVRAAAPDVEDGLPVVVPVSFVQFFEDDAGGGYATIQLSAFNWNRRRKAAHKLDPFGKTASGIPSKRKPAADVLRELLNGAEAREKQIAAIAHPGLRRRLMAANFSTLAAKAVTPPVLPNQLAGEEFIEWLKQTTRQGLLSGVWSNHPADVERRRLLQQFVDTSSGDILTGDAGAGVPAIIGVRCLNRDTGSVSKVNVPRQIEKNATAQFYQSETPSRERYVGYRERDGELDTARPIVFAVSHVGALSRESGGRLRPVSVPSESPLRGRPLGAPGTQREFEKSWTAAFEELCLSEGIVKRFRLTQGCVIEKLDGTLFQLRNFDKGQPWMKGGPFKHIRRVHRTPFVAMRRMAGATSQQ